MEYYDNLFDKNNSAFILKEESLRYIPVTIPMPPKANPMNSYKDRTVDTVAGIKLTI